MAHIDPFTGSLIPNGVPIVRCPNGHINRADSWTEGNRCHHPGCDHIGAPIPVNFSQSQDAPAAQPSVPSNPVPVGQPSNVYFPPHPPRNIQVSDSSQLSGQYENTSGTGANAIVPTEVSGLCWGAFLLNFLWCIGNRAWLAAFLFFIPFINFLMPLVLLFKGNEWAWRKRRWRSIEQFKRAQRVWTVSGITMYALVLVLTMHEGMVLESMIDQMQQRFFAEIQQLEELLLSPPPRETETQVVTPGVQEGVSPQVEESTPDTPQSPAATAAAVSTQIPEVRILLNAVNIRAGPGTKYEIIGFAAKDSLLTVLATDVQRNWYLVSLEDGRLGWVGNTVVEPVNSLRDIKIAVTIPALPPEE